MKVPLACVVTGTATSDGLWIKEIHGRPGQTPEEARDVLVNTAGHEWTGRLGGGVGPHEHLAITIGLSWLLALPDHDLFGLAIPGRQVLSGHLGLAGRWDDWLWIGAEVGIPLVGRRWPTGPVLALSVSGRIWMTRGGADRRP